MKGLSRFELDLLEKIARGQPDHLPPRSGQALQRLLSLGFVEETPGVRLPLEMMRVTYRLTPAGRAFLRKQ